MLRITEPLLSKFIVVYKTSTTSCHLLFEDKDNLNKLVNLVHGFEEHLSRKFIFSSIIDDSHAMVSQVMGLKVC